MGATYVGVRRAHPYSWLLCSPHTPLETDAPPTVSLAPHYTSQRPCRAILFFARFELSRITSKNAAGSRLRRLARSRSDGEGRRFFSGANVEIAGSGSDRALDRVGDSLRVVVDFKLAFTLDHDPGKRLRPRVAEQQASLVREPFLDVSDLSLNRRQIRERDFLPDAHVDENLRILLETRGQLGEGFVGFAERAQ